MKICAPRLAADATSNWLSGQGHRHDLPATLGGLWKFEILREKLRSFEDLEPVFGSIVGPFGRNW